MWIKHRHVDRERKRYGEIERKGVDGLKDIIKENLTKMILRVCERQERNWFKKQIWAKEENMKSGCNWKEKIYKTKSYLKA